MRHNFFLKELQQKEFYFLHTVVQVAKLFLKVFSRAVLEENEWGVVNNCFIILLAWLTKAILPANFRPHSFNQIFNLFLVYAGKQSGTASNWHHNKEPYWRQHGHFQLGIGHSVSFLIIAHFLQHWENNINNFTLHLFVQAILLILQLVDVIANSSSNCRLSIWLWVKLNNFSDQLLH